MSATDDSANVYDQRNIDTMEIVYGEGYLSAGGDTEVAHILSGIDLREKQVLDVGCGLGGAVVTMARDHGAGHVHGIDTDRQVLERADALVERAQVAEQVTLSRVAPGPLPFDDGSFDVVYLNAVSCHIEDLAAFFAQIHRVLREGGTLVGSEWYRLQNNQSYRRWDELLRERGLNFHFVPRDRFELVLEQCGFRDLSFVDRTAAFSRMASASLSRVENELRTRLHESLGERGLADFLQWTRLRAAVFHDGGMSQQHFRAVR